ncbi:MAG: S41 family peptidase [Elusimicrobiota bacterium]|jgi:carboxyl-terminal processing protease
MTKRKLSGLAFGAALVVLTQMPPVRSGADAAYGQIKLLVDVLQHIREQYVEEVERKDLIYGAAAGMVRTLDPFSQFMEPEAHREMRTETEGEFGGLGIRIAVREGWLVVVTPLPETPAYRLGILPGDKIVKIEGESTQGITVVEAVQKLRGKPKTKVTITVFREGTEEPRDYTITREIIRIQSVRSLMKDGGVGYIRLAEFIEPSLPDLVKAMKALEKEGMKSLVLDLRNNPGGLLSSAVDVCKVFLGENKLLVYTQGRTQPRQDFKADGKALYPDIPVVVLVNHGSASGSEIVAGALQDHRRALILGSETFGKASVQSIIGLDDGSALRLTTAKYYTPNGRLIHRDEKSKKGGITPDIVINIPKETEAKLQAQSEELYSKDKKPRSIVKEEEHVRDEAMERAVEMLKAQAIFEKVKKG